MKKILLSMLAIFISVTVAAQEKKINVKKSIITWTGKKVTGEHSGTITFKEGALLFKSKKIAGGTFVADMTTLSNTDQSGKGKDKLEGHLKSVDFFNTEDFVFDTSKMLKLLIPKPVGAEIEAFFVSGEALKFVAGISGSTEQWQTVVRHIDNLGTDTMLVEANLDIRLLTKEPEIRTAIFRLVRVGSAWKIAAVESFELR